MSDSRNISECLAEIQEAQDALELMEQLQNDQQMLLDSMEVWSSQSHGNEVTSNLESYGNDYTDEPIEEPPEVFDGNHEHGDYPAEPDYPGPEPPNPRSRKGMKFHNRRILEIYDQSPKRFRELVRMSKQTFDKILKEIEKFLASPGKLQSRFRTNFGQPLKKIVVKLTKKAGILTHSNDLITFF